MSEDATQIYIDEYLDITYSQKDDNMSELSSQLQLFIKTQLQKIIESGKNGYVEPLVLCLESDEIQNTKSILTFQAEKLDQKIHQNTILNDKSLLTRNKVQGDPFSYKDQKPELSVRILDPVSISEISSDLDSSVCLVTDICSWVLLGFILLSVFNSLGEIELNGLFYFISFLQSNNLFAYINFLFPQHYNCIFQSLSKFNFKTFLNLPYIINSIDASGSFTSQAPPDIFAAYGISSNFFDYGGRAITAIFLLFLIWLIAEMFSVSDSADNAFPLMMKHVSDKILWNGTIRVLQVTFMPLFLAACLQFQNPSFDNTTNTLGFIFAIITCIILLIFMISSIRLARAESVREKAYRSRVGALYNDYWLDKEIDCCTVNFELFILIKKVLQVIGIVFIRSLPSIQAIIFLTTESVQVISLLTKRRFKDKTVEKVINLMSMGNMLNILIICLILLLDESRSKAAVLAWIIFGIACFSYLIALVLILAEQILALAEIKEFYTDFFYGLYVGLIAFGSCCCCICIGGNKMYWSKRAKAHEIKEKSSQLALM